MDMDPRVTSITPHLSAHTEILELSPPSQTKYKLTITGNTISFHKLPEHAPVMPSYGYAENRGDNLIARTKSRKNALHKLLQTLSTKPSCFMTLDFEGRTAGREQIRRAKRCLDSFARVLRRERPSSWFVWKLELSEKRTLHFHLVGDFGPGGAMPAAKLRESWQRIAGTDWDDCFDLRPCTEAHLGYLTKKAKFAADMALVALDPQGRSFGILGKSNMPTSKPRTIILDENQMAVARQLLATCTGNEKHSKRLLRAGAGLVMGVPEGIQGKLLNEASQEATTPRTKQSAARLTYPPSRRHVNSRHGCNQGPALENAGEALPGPKERGAFWTPQYPKQLSTRRGSPGGRKHQLPVDISLTPIRNEKKR